MRHSDNVSMSRRQRCPHCGGTLVYDPDEHEWRCLLCARTPGGAQRPWEPPRRGRQTHDAARKGSEGDEPETEE